MPNKETAKGRKQHDSASASGPANYDPGARPTITLTELVQLDSENDATASAADTASGQRGHIAQATSVNGNDVSVALYNTDSTVNNNLGLEVDSGTTLTTTTIKVEGRGF